MTIFPKQISTTLYDMSDPQAYQAGLAAAAQAIADGRLVAFPTETVYGLGANALNSTAVLSIFAAKGRPADNPLIVHIPALHHLYPLVTAVPAQLPVLAAHFWPGPLTMILPKSTAVPEAVTAGLDTVAIRIPQHSVALALLEKCGLPIAAPSANLSGRPSPTSAAHVMADLNGKIAAVLDGGPTDVGLESTVLDLTAEVPTVLRPGGVTIEAISAVIGPVRLDPRAMAVALAADQGGPVRSPGMKYKHYAPVAPTTLVEGEPEKIWPAIWQMVQTDGANGPVGLVLTTEGKLWLDENHQGAVDAGEVMVAVVGSRTDPAMIARHVFSSLREMDAAGVHQIIIEGLPAQGLGLAIMNRLRRAAGGRIYQAGGTT